LAVIVWAGSHWNFIASSQKEEPTLSHIGSIMGIGNPAGGS